MSQTKDNRPRRRPLSNGFDYTHARYFADVLCDPDTAPDVQTTARLCFAELCLLLGLQMPEAAETPKAWNAVRQSYVDMRRAIESLILKHATEDEAQSLHYAAQKIIERELFTIPGLALQTASEFSQFLHRLWTIDDCGIASKESKYHIPRTPAYVASQVKGFQTTRKLIEKYGQGKVAEAAKARLDLSVRAFEKITRAIYDRPLEDFIKGTHFRATLTPTIKR
jgi:hypothetical protein